MSLEKTREAFEAGKSPTDRRLLAGPWIHGAVQAALEPGNDGWLGDGIAGYLPWASIPPTSLFPSPSGTARTTGSSRSDTARTLSSTTATVACGWPARGSALFTIR